ncbi:MAG: hypothetical protein Q9160_008028 [Pyrenula sp. 1 TL-2023]
MAVNGDTAVYRASTTAPVNIAVIKYWGKRDARLNLPTNSSLSVTLSQASLRTHTTASCSPAYLSVTGDTLLLNGKPEPIGNSQRTLACLASLRTLRRALEISNPNLRPLSKYPLHLVSRNNFPTAAGLASSAAGFAALVRAIANLYELPQSPAELSEIARQGSGSACRSLMGGFVAWRAGKASDGSDSIAEVVAPAAHWPTMRAVILVANPGKKAVSSTSGMQTTVATSALFPHRAQTVVPAAMARIEKAILERDFATFAETTMRDSNSFHACCADTWPPIAYLTDVSRAAIRLVEDINLKSSELVAAYTFDAGPNAVIYYEELNEPKVAGTLRAMLGALAGWEGPYGDRIRGFPDGMKGLDETAVRVVKEGVQRVICTGVGEGPERTREHLISEKGEVL